MQDNYSGPERRSSEQAWSTFAAQLSSLHADVGEIKQGMADFRHGMERLTSAITKLALVEERQTHANQAIERCFKQAERLQGEIDKLSNRLSDLEKAEPAQARTAEWVDRAVWAAAAAACAALASKLGLMG